MLHIASLAGEARRVTARLANARFRWSLTSPSRFCLQTGVLVHRFFTTQSGGKGGSLAHPNEAYKIAGLAHRSSNISSVGYDEGTLTLEVEFTDGSVYQYFDVPESVHEGLMQASSKGAYMHTHVRDNYQYGKLRQFESHLAR